MDTILHVCTTCRQGRTIEPGASPPGQTLHDALINRADRRGDPIIIRGLACLVACDRGCAAVVASAGKWSTLLGGLDAGHADDLLDYVAAYAASPNGMVLPSRRAASLRRAILGRVPG